MQQSQWWAHGCAAAAVSDSRLHPLSPFGIMCWVELRLWTLFEVNSFSTDQRDMTSAAHAQMQTVAAAFNKAPLHDGTGRAGGEREREGGDITRSPIKTAVLRGAESACGTGRRIAYASFHQRAICLGVSPLLHGNNSKMLWWGTRVWIKTREVSVCAHVWTTKVESYSELNWKSYSVSSKQVHVHIYINGCRINMHWYLFKFILWQTTSIITSFNQCTFHKLNDFSSVKSCITFEIFLSQLFLLDIDEIKLRANGNFFLLLRYLFSVKGLRNVSQISEEMSTMPQTELRVVKSVIKSHYWRSQ